MTKIAIDPKERVLTELFKRTVERHPNRVFLQFAARDLTYSQVHSLSNQVGNALVALGLESGSKLAIMVPNSEEFVLSWFGAAKVGVVYVPINTEYRGQILAYQLDKADVTHMVIDAQYLERLEAVLADVPKLRHVFVRGNNALRPMLGGRVSLTPFSRLLDAPAHEPAQRPGYTDPLAISFTSGTTGPSKGVLTTHCHVVTFALDWIRATGFPDGGSIYSPLPLFHAIAAWLGVVPTLLQGGRIALAERFSASAFWDEVRRYDAQLAHGIFSMVPILLKQPERADDALQPARVFYIAKRDPVFERRFNCHVVEVFGATETGIVTLAPPSDEAKIGSCGRPNNETFEVMIANERDEPVARGEVGEILVRPRQPYAMFGQYYRMPEATIEAFRNQWFHTGDAAREDEDGFYWFTDRVKDSIRRRGENISSYELESAVLQHPAILECAAVAIKSDIAEDDLKIAVVLRENMSLSAEELWKFCETHMPRFWVPRYIEFFDELPKTPNHKVRKFVLRGKESAGHLYDRNATGAHR